MLPEKLEVSISNGLGVVDMCVEKVFNLWFKYMLNKYKKQIDGITLIMAIIIPLVTVPQLVKIWMEQNVTWISIITWSVYFINAIIWFLYWIVNKDNKIIILNILLIIINFWIVLWIIMFQ